MTVQQAETKICERLEYTFWRDRAVEMLRHMTEHSDEVTTVSNLRVPPQWPAVGAITFRRDVDGKRVRLWRDGRKHKFLATAN
jgi:hypothetical protein